MRRLLSAAVLAAVLIGVPASAQAQQRSVFFGPQISWADDADVGIGFRVQGQLPQTDFGLVGSFDYFFPGGNVDYWELNFNGVYRFILPDLPTVAPYAGAGLNVARTTIDRSDFGSTDIGLNILGGARFEAGPTQPFVEIRFEIDGGEQFVLTGGLLF